MKQFIISLLAILSAASIFSQVVTTEPALPIHNMPVTIIFHADQGDKGLMNYTSGDIYAHTGVITDQSTSPSDWKYVKAEWNVNTAACKLTKVSDNEYSLQVPTTIRQFYGVPANEKILQMAFVFRNATGSKTGRDTGGSDLFVDVYEAGIQVSFIQPANEFSFAASDSNIPVQVSANDADSVLLYLDGKLIAHTPMLDFDTALVAGGYIRHELVVWAKKNGTSASDTVWYMVPAPVIPESLPEGIQDGITYAGSDSVLFSLYAPGKGHIYLIGDFNNWLPDSSYQLNQDGDHFWIALGGLIPGKEYAFQYMIDETLRIADPYSEKILDPFNDQFIPQSVYPVLMDYPLDKTSQITGVVQPGKTPFVWNDNEYVPPASEKLIIYELLIRDFVSSHDIKDVEGKLDYLQTLGVNAIELMPFNEFEGNSSWGYNPSFYFATDKYYGTDTDFKNFIRECHKRGIAVIMDIVLNHSYGQSPLVRMYFNSATGKPSPANPWYNTDSPNTTYSWGYDFNHESEATRYFVDRVVEYWLTEYKVDGFRFDFTKGFTNTPGDGSAYDASRIAILKRIYDKIKNVNPDAYMICEHFAPNNEEEILSDYGMLIWGNINYNYNEATMGYLANSGFSWGSYEARGWTNPALVSYMESHDEERLMYKNITYGNSNTEYNIKDPATALQRMELAGAFFFTIPGPKMIWQFGELGYDVSIDFNGRVGEKPVKWDYLDDAGRYRLYLTWAKILDLRKKYPVFSTDDFILTVGNNIALKKIVLRHESGDAVVAGNFGMIPGETMPGFTSTGWWHEAFTGDSINVTDVNQVISLQPGEYRIYSAGKMESVITAKNEISTKVLSVYPNPVSDFLHIHTDETLVQLEIISISGVRVLTLTNPGDIRGVDVTDLPEGFYLVRAITGSGLFISKFVKKN